MSDTWRNDFWAFVSDMGDKPDGFSIDRIDNDGNYSKENCRWVDEKTQQNNKSTNVRLTKDGKTLTLSQWADELGVKYSTLQSRWNNGHKVDDILTSKMFTGKSIIPHLPKIKVEVNRCDDCPMHSNDFDWCNYLSNNTRDREPLMDCPLRENDIQIKLIKGGE